MIKKILSSQIFILLMAVIIGIVIGRFLPVGAVGTVMSIKQVAAQIIFFMVPLIIIGFVAPSIARLKSGATRIILFAFAIAYISSLLAAAFGVSMGKLIVPMLNIREASGSVELPQQLFTLEIPPVMSVMTALVLAVFLGLGTAWVGAERIASLLDEFQKIVLKLVSSILIPILPVFIAANFAIMSFQGDISRLWIFLPVILIVIVCHFVWLAIVYGAAALYSGKNSWEVLKHYAPAYFTAVGTMSSAATLGVALKCAHKSSVLDKDIVDFAVPLFANIHLCGSVLTESFFICVVSQLLYGYMPSTEAFILFIFLFGVFAIGAPGVPGGTVLASLGLVTAVIGFDETGTAMLIAIFALQDSFGTACNVTADGALTLMVNKFAKKSTKPEMVKE